MSRFKVALFTGNYNHIRDGVSLTLNRMVKFMLENDIEFRIFGPTIDQPALEHEGTFVSVPSVSLPGRPEYRVSTSLSSEAKRHLHEFDPDLVHIATPDLLGYKALRWAMDFDKPVVSSYHTHFTSYLKYYKLSFLEPLLWKYLNWFYGHCEQLYVPTPSMAEWLEEMGVVADLKIWSRGIDTDHFNPENRSDDWRKKHGFKPDDVVVSFVSRLVWEKNLKLYADVVKRLQEKYKNLKAMIVGDGPAGDELKQILPNAVYTGFLTGDELSKAYANSDIFFFPSDTETFGNVTLEAMASGLPCVVADAVGSKSLVDHGGNGYLAPVEKSDLFYSYIEKLVLNPDLRQKMANASLQKAGNYSWQNINGKLLSYYEQVLDL
ncbi:glycosyltransferase family 4 protein [Rhodohalobacter barkolensis]|uniref:Glycosyltransferase family 1 protein n=1 Tax=Rhodohalobacter barkolensis TaxID=2053187 RepID=A0A2N0VIF4_9BACT|nr:glycosyltransferase family 1 protein [Rhodohalobacter barkolensis]PKD43966.1 glycosyltransferase family 1 protein [Rhodohalobacter barkolensis]